MTAAHGPEQERAGLAAAPARAVAAAGAPARPPGKPGATAARAGGYVARPVFLATPPVIDGKLDEPVWKTGAKLDKFVQFEPHEGEPATEQTEVYLGYDT